MKMKTSHSNFKVNNCKGANCKTCKNYNPGNKKCSLVDVVMQTQIEDVLNQWGIGGQSSTSLMGGIYDSVSIPKNLMEDMEAMSEKMLKMSVVKTRNPSHMKCINNTGMEQNFTKGLEYFIEDVANKEFFLVEDDNGIKRTVLKERFESKIKINYKEIT